MQTRRIVHASFAALAGLLVLPTAFAQNTAPKPATPAASPSPTAKMGKMTSKKKKTSTSTRKMPARDPKTGRFIKGSAVKPSPAAPPTPAAKP